MPAPCLPPPSQRRLQLAQQHSHNPEVCERALHLLRLLLLRRVHRPLQLKRYALELCLQGGEGIGGWGLGVWS